mgnify:CR=1 FL=1
MAEYIERSAGVSILRAKANMAVLMDAAPYFEKAAQMLEKLPASDVAPIEALERLRDELYEQDLITMEGLKKLNTLIGKYTTVHDGGANHDA